MKRIKKVDKNPNPLFLQWLTEFRDEAQGKENKGLVKIYNMCIENLAKYVLSYISWHFLKFPYISLHSTSNKIFLSRFPLTLDNGHQCKIIQGFGKTICQKLEDKLVKHRREEERVSLNIPVSPVVPPPARTVSSPPIISKTVATEVSPSKSKKHTSMKLSSEVKVREESQEPDYERDVVGALKRSVDESGEVKAAEKKKSCVFDEENDIEEALRRSLDETEHVEKRNHSEDDDFQLALQLSQEEEDKVNKDQEEEDRLLAMKLQEEFNKESQTYQPRVERKSPLRESFRFDNDVNIPSGNNVLDDDDDLPDIPEVASTVSSSSSRKITDRNVERVKKVHEISFNSDEEMEKAQSSKKKTPTKPRSEDGKPDKRRTPVKNPGKEYVPRHRSGAYAVLITLYHESCKDEFRGHVSKNWLQTEAQNLADESFTCTSKSEHYTAWSGITNLVKHGLITRWSNPAKFNITEKGVELAARMLEVERGDQSRDVSENKRKHSNNDADTDHVRTKRLAKFDEPGPSSSSYVDHDHIEPSASVSVKKNEISSADFDLGDTFNMIEDDQPRESAGDKVPVSLQLQKLYNDQMTAEVENVDRNVAEFELRAGNFDIVLCVDNTEIKGGGVGGRKTLREETVRHLQRCGVMYDRRNLNIGDFLWIARERVEEVRGQYDQREARELVLPFIVERKRLDDLWQSVKDGRYEEQKFRLKGCGLKHLYYLIEDFPTKREFWGRAGGGGNLVTPEAIEQAIANTAVQEGFTVKKTDDQKGTIEYLTLVTRLLKRKYQNKNLRSCSQTDIADGLVGCRDTTLLPFKHFNETSRKNKDLSIGEVWAKMLLRMKGLSVDMAQAIVSQYPTPRDLREAYNKCGTDQEKVKMLNDLTYGIENKRKIPKTVSEALMKVWNKDQLN